jgi:phosphoenolpyruvate carboxykinase (GTP)
VETPIGFLPTPKDLDTSGLDIESGDLETILSVDINGWREAVPQIREHYASFGDKLPNQLNAALDALDKSLANA